MQTSKELLGARIKEVRKLRQLSQERLAERVGVEPKQISRIEGGKSSPSMDTLESIARELQVEMKDLFDFRHLEGDERLDDQAYRLLQLMDDKTKRLAVRLLGTLAS
ncbi:helix-turn-helix transcriptional regulator [Geotalea sp. SG265]|uniref:helix-turn-helix domain-containing protein n=1 Tax=Geotalea sp. SG265 TaxID=2922867 RepID=UPI001FAF3321|nr:helix-turn-helix transcriptional regulator [Geotalea sp. SG265]